MVEHKKQIILFIGLFFRRSSQKSQAKTMRKKTASVCEKSLKQNLLFQKRSFRSILKAPLWIALHILQKKQKNVIFLSVGGWDLMNLLFCCIFHTNKFESTLTPITMLSSNKRVSNEKSNYNRKLILLPYYDFNQAPRE